MKKSATSYSAALLTLGAAAIHFAAAPEHFSEYLPYGIFFVALGIAQVGLAIALLIAPSRRVYGVALIGTLTVIGIWLMSRTVGMPIAPKPWRPEEIGFTDLAATLLEAISCVLFLLRLRRLDLRPGRLRIVLRTLPAFLFAPLLAFGGVGGALTPMPGAYNSAPFIAGLSSTSLVNLVAPDGAQPLKEFTLTASVITIGGHTAWAYNGSVPGPELRITQGDRVKVILVNHLPVATSIHWHGINVPNASDGVSGITQDAVQPGGFYVYEFIANDAGTYWYHSHQDTMNQIPQGLVGSIVVEPKAANARVRDYSVLVHEQPGSGVLQVNGRSSLHLDATPGETVRLRITEAAEPGLDLEPLKPVLVGAPYMVAALDGHDLVGPQELGPERIPIGMGQRADLVFTMPAAGSVKLLGLTRPPIFPWSPNTSPVVTLGDGPAPASVNTKSLPTFDLTNYGTRAPDAVADAGQYDVTRQIVLGGGIAFRNGSLNFIDTFGGHASPYIAPLRVREGQLVHLQITNPGDHSTHPIHIHGHVFTLLAKNGLRLTGSPVHTDTVLVGAHETWDVAFKADNPGVWMLHCHILEHAAAGMSMTINYEGIYTPFAMGTRSGNIPE